MEPRRAVQKENIQHRIQYTNMAATDMDALEAVLRALNLTPDAVHELVENAKQAQATQSVKKDETLGRMPCPLGSTRRKSSETKKV